MTTFDRFDPFERRIGEALEGIAPPRPLDYLDDTFRQTERMSQRPRWSFLERWFNVDTTLARPMFGQRVPIRSVLILALLAALVAATAVVIGSQKRLPAPIGPARNGQIVYGIGGDIYVRDSVLATSRLLLGGPSEQGGVVVSPDGQLIAYDSIVNGVDHAWAANIDGSNPRQILERPFTGRTFQWSYDSTAAVAITDVKDYRELWVAPADGSGAKEIELPGLWAQEATWDPTQHGVLLVRGEDRQNGQIDLYYVDVSGANPAVISKIDMPNGPQLYGPDWEYAAITFSPDGSKIAYAVVEGPSAENAHFRTYLMNRDGTDVRQIGGPTDGMYNQSWPTFSPDGKTIALESWFATSSGSVNTAAIAPSDLSAPAILVGPSVQHSLLKSWSPDGTRLLIHPVDTNVVYSIDPIKRTYEQLPMEMDYVPGWQRLAP